MTKTSFFVIVVYDDGDYLDNGDKRAVNPIIVSTAKPGQRFGRGTGMTFPPRNQGNVSAAGSGQRHGCETGETFLPRNQSNDSATEGQR